MASYSFVTVWQVRAPIDAVWEAIYQADQWPRWWKGVQRVISLEPAAPDGLGGRTRYVWKSALPYRLTIDMTTTELERPYRLAGRAVGELRGEGRWLLQEQDGITTVRYDWQVETTKAWMNLLAPVARPLFRWNHDVVMRQGGEGLRRWLEAGPAATNKSLEEAR